MSKLPPLAVSDVCAILKVCGESNVASLKWGEFHVEFGPKSPPQDEITGPPPLPAAEIAEIQAQVAKTALLTDEIELKEQRIAMAILEDPDLAEDLIVQGELEDVGTSEED